MLQLTQVVNADKDSVSLDSLFEFISQSCFADESAFVKELVALLNHDQSMMDRISKKTENLITQVRNSEKKGFGIGIDVFLQQYSLSTQEGIVLMSLAESLLRIPDSATADKLIKDKLGEGNWAQYLKQSDSSLVNASTWGLIFSGKVLSGKARWNNEDKLTENGVFNRLLKRLGEPVIRKAIYGAMKLMGQQFVLGETIETALKNSHADRKQGYNHSFDILGEAALTKKDANAYFNNYANAIKAIGKHSYDDGVAAPSISIKLSALHPRYDEQNRQRVLTELYETCLKLVELAREANIGLTLDAEEMDRLELSLSLFEKLYTSPLAQGWGQLGIVVQAYSKRALASLCWLTKLAKSQGDKIPVRLVKGAYWDSEIKWSQVRGDQAYPVFTRKVSTDISYLACAKYLLSSENIPYLFPQFASHNAQTIIAIMEMAAQNPSDSPSFEFQRLHGMGQQLYNSILTLCDIDNVRIYAPVGRHKELLPYLVRRLLENGANSSFVHQLLDSKVPISSLCEDPVSSLAKYSEIANSRIPLPEHIFRQQNNSARANSKGVNLAIAHQRHGLLQEIEAFKNRQWQAGSLIYQSEKMQSNNDFPDKETVHQAEDRIVFSPFDTEARVGKVSFADEHTINTAFEQAKTAFADWRQIPVSDRANCLLALADLFELHRAELISLCIREAGKTLQDSIDEIREAIDFCRYYAQQAQIGIKPFEMQGPTGETNRLIREGKGIFVCISPWNFPLAIFIGQVSAALVTGNCVIAKPAEQTCLIAHRAVQLAYEAGIPTNVLQLILGNGHQVGAKLIEHCDVDGVCFTGSTATAKSIQRQLANKDGAIVPLIAETGGQNVMIVDSTALLEQVVKDVISSAFSSAGQRCSALRVLYLQDEIADECIELLKGAMAELRIDSPEYYHSDLASVIDAKAQQQLHQHIENIMQQGKVIYQCSLGKECQRGYFVAPFAIEIDDIHLLKQEQFGPVLHVIRYKSEKLNLLVQSVNNMGYGLTLGIHSRNNEFAQSLAKKLNVGNVYINRNQIGAVVGVQAFGGRGLSGTGPKAGGPHYLNAFLTEKTITNNIAAIGGNTGLLSLDVS